METQSLPAGNCRTIDRRNSGRRIPKAGSGKDGVDAFGLDLLVNGPRTGDEPGRHFWRLVASLGDAGEGAEIFDASVGAGAEENVVDFLTRHGLPRNRI